MERCQTTHATDEAKENKQQRRLAEAKVRELYFHSDNVSRTDRDAIFLLPQEEKLKEPAGSLLCWADLVLPTVKEAVKAFKTHEARTQTTFLIPTMLTQ